MLTPQNAKYLLIMLRFFPKCYVCYCNDFTRIILHKGSFFPDDDDDDESNPKNRLSLMLMAVKKYTR